jgi:CHAT domain-containing protein/tetratricopeptide (TPR) repeat protein
MTAARWTTTRRARALVLVFIIGIAGCQLDGLPATLSGRKRATIYEAVHMHTRAVELYVKGSVSNAIAVGKKVVELFEVTLGPTHAHIAIPLSSLAVFHQSLGEYAEAESSLLRVLSIQEIALGPLNVDLAEHLDQLAGLYKEWGTYDKAIPLYRRALSIRQRTLQSAHPDIMVNLINLASIYAQQGEYSKAEPLYVRALAVAERNLGPAHAAVARSLNGLGMVYWAQGTYARAEPLLVRALRISEGLVAEVRRHGLTGIATTMNLFDVLDKGRSAFGSKSVFSMSSLYGATIIAFNSGTVRSLSNLNELYSVPIPRAEPLTTRTADIFDSILAAAYSGLRESLGNLAQHYVATGEYSRAEPLLVRAIDTQEVARRVTHPDAVSSLNNLAQLYQTQGEYTKAETLLVRVLDLRKKAVGPMHADVARSLNNLALLYRLQGAYAKAEPLLGQAVAIFEETLGEMHPDVARSLNNLAMLYHEQGRYADAAPLYERAVEVLSKAPGGMPPDAARCLNNLAVLYHATGAYMKAEPLMARAAELRDSQVHRELARLSTPRKRALMQLLRHETESLVSLHVDSTPASPVALRLALTAVLKRKGLVLESLVDNRAAARSHLTPAVRAKLDRLAAASSELSRLLHAPVPPHATAAHASAVAALRARIEVLESEVNTESTETRAQAPLVTPARIQNALPYGTALVELVRYHRFDPWQDRQRVQEARYAAYVLQRQGLPRWVALGDAMTIDAGVDAVLARMRPGGGTDAARSALQHLDALLFGPIREYLSGVSHVVISPDGKLNLVPFEALIDPQGRYELEHRLVSYVTSGRDLLQLGLRPAPRSPAMIVAAPDYGRGPQFAPLPGSLSEALDVAAHFRDGRVLIRNQVTKATLASIVGPSVLHVATHGFYARSAASATLATAGGTRPRAQAELLERDMFIEGSLAPVQLSSFGDPAEALDRAGLALANANVRSDGIITAREIAHQDWWGTQLVVLSACQTGVGAAPDGEGVYGLRLALALAGAESQVVSLWNVADSSARVLMREFYGELARGAGRAQALRQAKLRMLQQPRFAHPYYWAPFIHAGAWTPLAKGVIQAKPTGASTRTGSGAAP